MSTKLYVGGLAFETTEAELEAAFKEFGTVTSTAIIMDRESGRSKGFGFVELSSPEEAKKAIEGMNDKEFAGRKLTVNEARPKEDRSSGDSFRKSY